MYRLVRWVYIKQDNFIHSRWDSLCAVHLTVGAVLTHLPGRILHFAFLHFSFQVSGGADQGGVLGPGVVQVPARGDAHLHLRPQGHGVGHPGGLGGGLPAQQRQQRVAHPGGCVLRVLVCIKGMRVLRNMYGSVARGGGLPAQQRRQRVAHPDVCVLRMPLFGSAYGHVGHGMRPSSGTWCGPLCVMAHSCKVQRQAGGGLRGLPRTATNPSPSSPAYANARSTVSRTIRTCTKRHHIIFRTSACWGPDRCNSRAGSLSMCFVSP